MHKFLLLSLVFFQILSCKSQSNAPEKYTYEIPIGENSWVSNNQEEDGKIIKKEGIQNWDGALPIHTYFHTSERGTIKVGLSLKSAPNDSHLKISHAGKSKNIKLKETRGTIYVGEFDIEEPGYQQLTLELVNPGKAQKININNLLLAGAAAEGEVYFNKDNFHFGRRGPSVHLRYPIPQESEKPQYFYNEIKVPEGEDVIGSYYMANGFAHGYFGIQVNSENERRILFSVWSPFETQDPNEIPEDHKIVLLKKGNDVNTGKFGNEGSGGQSFKRYMWKAGTTYRFLLKGEPNGKNHTDYTAYFYAPEKGQWELIASFRRPKSGNYLGRLYSFLENFVPATGDTTRKANYKNQWLYDEDKGWIELTNAIFTADATAMQKDRLDYAGGETAGGYFMKNCGFFDNNTKINSEFSRSSTGKAPEIDFEDLP